MLPGGFAAGVLRRIGRDQGERPLDRVPTMASVSTIELEALRHSDVGFLLLDVLPKQQFDDDHIGGAQNVPLDSLEFLIDVERLAGGKSRKVVVYGSGPASDTAGRAAQRLTGAGYADVATYGGGLHEWRHRAFVVPAPDPRVALVPAEPDAASGRS